MAKITPAQEKKLRQAGYPQTVIEAYKSGKLDPTTQRKINSLISPVPLTAGGFNFGQTPRTTTPPNPRQPFRPSTPQRSSPGLGIDLSGLALPFNLGITPKPPRALTNPTYPWNQPPSQPDIPYGRKGPVPGTVPTTVSRNTLATNWGNRDTRLPTFPGYGQPATGRSTPRTTYTPAERQAEDEALDRRTPGRQAEIDLTNTNQQSLPEAPAPPVYPDINIPEVVLRDFTDKVRQQFAEAYAPLYKAVNLGKQNARQQQGRSDQIIEGLYSNLAQDIINSGQAQAGQYAQSGRQAQATSQALQNRIGEIYGGSNQQEAALARSLGQEGAAGELLANNATERQFQQSQAAQEGAAQQDYYTQGGQTVQDYNTDVANAARTEGAGRRSDLVADLANVLTQYDQQGLGYKNQELLGAIQQGNALSDRDLQAQQANVNAILQRTGLTDARIGNQYEGQWNAYESLINQRNAEADRLAAIIAAEQEQRNADRDYNLDRRRVEVAEREAGATDQPPLSPNSQVNLDALSAIQTGSEEMSRWPIDQQSKAAKVYVDYAVGVLNGLMGQGGTEKVPNFLVYLNEVQNQAEGSGIDKELASTIAASVWSNLYGGK